MTKDQYDRLIAATDKLQVAQAEVHAICAEIAAGDGPPDVLRLGRARTGKGRGRQGGRGKSAGRQADAGAPQPKKQPAKKVKCSECGTVTGSQLVGDKRMPLRHKNPATGGRCKGIFKPAELVTAGQG